MEITIARGHPSTSTLKIHNQTVSYIIPFLPEFIFAFHCTAEFYLM